MGNVCLKKQLITNWTYVTPSHRLCEQASTSHGSDMKGCLMLTLIYATRVLMLLHCAQYKKKLTVFYDGRHAPARARLRLPALRDA